MLHASWQHDTSQVLQPQSRSHAVGAIGSGPGLLDPHRADTDSVTSAVTADTAAKVFDHDKIMSAEGGPASSDSAHCGTIAQSNRKESDTESRAKNAAISPATAATTASISQDNIDSNTRPAAARTAVETEAQDHQQTSKHKSRLSPADAASGSVKRSICSPGNNAQQTPDRQSMHEGESLDGVDSSNVSSITFSQKARR
eukprot:SAG31_NODE_2707_length_5211_cov_7.051601_4_plen_200_part_00